MTSYLVWSVFFGTLAGLCALAATDEAHPLSVLFGGGAVFTVGRLRNANECGADYFLQGMDVVRSSGQSLHPARNVGRLPAR